MEKYIAYYRISKEGKSNSEEKRFLGLEAQQQIVEHYYPVLDRTFTEIKSAKNITEREELKKAIEYCKKNNCTLVVAKLDRLSRSVEDVLFILKELKNRVLFCDIPGTPDKFTVTLYAAFAERERELISLRTSQALKQKVKTEGEFRKGSTLFNSGGANKLAVKAIKEKAKNNPANKIATTIVCSAIKEGLTLNQIAERLNTSGCQTPSGSTNWTATQVARIRNKFCK